MSLPGSATVPAVDSRRLRLAKQTGMQIVRLIEEEIRPRDISHKIQRGSVHKESGIAILKGTLASEGSVVKQSALTRKC